MTYPPEPPTAPAAGQAHLDDQARKLLAAVEDAMRTPTSYRDDTPVPTIGTTPPVDQPGRPSMSQKATDDSVRMWSFGGMTVLVCGGVALVMAVSDRADPTAIGVFFGGLATLALAIARLLRRAGQVAPNEIHNHISGPVHVDKRQTHTENKGVWVKDASQK